MFPECCSPQLEADLFDKQDLARAKVAALKVFFYLLLSSFGWIWYVGECHLIYLDSVAFQEVTPNLIFNEITRRPSNIKSLYPGIVAMKWSMTKAFEINLDIPWLPLMILDQVVDQFKAWLSSFRSQTATSEKSCTGCARNTQLFLICKFTHYHPQIQPPPTPPPPFLKLTKNICYIYRVNWRLFL